MAKAHVNLGIALMHKGRLDEAVACCRRAIEIDPKMAMVHANLADALQRKGLLDEAVACYRRALELDPGYANAHYNLGVMLAGKGQVDEAVACYRRAIKFDPRGVPAHINLGSLLTGKGRLDEAVACLRRAIELDPKIAEAHCSLAEALRYKGDFRAALDSMRTGHALGSERKGWPYPSAVWVKQAENLVQLDEFLAATSKGKARPASAAQCLALADFCRIWKQRPAAAVRFYTEAFTAEPKLAGDFQTAHRCHAARAAALAGCGKGKDAAGLDAKERARPARPGAGMAAGRPGVVEQGAEDGKRTEPQGRCRPDAAVAERAWAGRGARQVRPRGAARRGTLPVASLLGRSRGSPDQGLRIAETARKPTRSPSR